MANENLYVYEYAAKNIRQMRIGFIEINNATADVVTYRINYDNNKIISVKEYRKHNFKYKITYDNNVSIESLGLTGYTQENYVEKHKFYKNELYNMISQNFVYLTNHDKLQAVQR